MSDAPTDRDDIDEETPPAPVTLVVQDVVTSIGGDE